MSDLIRREDALDAIQKRADEIDSVYSAFWEGLKIAQDIVEKVPSAEPERTAKVIEHKYYIGSTLNIVGEWKFGYEYLCGNCKKKVIGGDEYCSHCGARLEWSDDFSVGKFEK